MRDLLALPIIIREETGTAVEAMRNRRTKINAQVIWRHFLIHDGRRR